MNYCSKVYLKIKAILMPLRGIKIGKKSIIGYGCKLGNPKSIVIGNNTFVDENVRLSCFTLEKDNPQIRIGDNCLIMNNVQILCADKIVIGDNCMVAAYSSIIDEDHGIDLSTKIPYKEQHLKTAPIVIGNNVWIGQKVCVMKGVTIGDNCIIGAGAIVTKDIPSDSIAVGNPAKIVKKWDHDSWTKVIQ